jgi:AcrR family transcriptional regulator
MALMTTIPVRERLIDAAFQLFGERGYELTTVEDIAERAGVGRTTFFRNFRSKDDVIFPDHEQLMEAIKARLGTSTNSTALVAVAEAVRLVLLRYIEEGERARLRYALTSRVSALRDREIASVAQYQRLFREFIGAWMGPSEANALRAELMASSVAAAHNHVLRRWLRGDTTEPIAEVDRAMAQVVELFSTDPAVPAKTAVPADTATTIIVLRTNQRPDEILPAIRRAIETDAADPAS